MVRFTLIWKFIHAAQCLTGFVAVAFEINCVFNHFYDEAALHLNMQFKLIS